MFLCTRDQVCLIALGSNMPMDDLDPVGVINAAIEKISDAITVHKISNFYATPAFPENSGPEFVNAAISVIYEGSPSHLLSLLHQVESDFGRIRTQRWGARIVDLDLIAVGDLIHPDPETYQYWYDLNLAEQQEQTPDELILPHPRLQDRAFVLQPLIDIAPDWPHPIITKTLQELYDLLPKSALKDIRKL